MLLHEVIANAAAVTPAAPALVWGDRTWSFAELDAAIVVAAARIAAVASPGERIAVVSDNHPDVVIAMYAAPAVGVIVMFGNTRLTPHELGALIDDVESGGRVRLTRPPRPACPRARRSPSHRTRDAHGRAGGAGSAARTNRADPRRQREQRPRRTRTTPRGSSTPAARPACRRARASRIAACLRRYSTPRWPDPSPTTTSTCSPSLSFTWRPTT
jgi:hypothetical protein